MTLPGLISLIGAERPKEAAASQGSPSQLNYWDYIRLDELLALAQPQTNLEDERVFIVFHQLAEMLLALIVNELEKLTGYATVQIPEWKMRLTRIVSICGLFIHNINALGRCINRDQFLYFREALAPASGFQSFQFRKMELMSTRLSHLAGSQQGSKLLEDQPLDLMFERLYWRQAIPASRPASERTSLLDFETRYLHELRNVAVEFEHRNLAVRFAALSHDLQSDEGLTGLLREFDRMVNQGWREAHHRLALTLLDASGEARSSTGGTDWKAYLRKSHQIRFFPELSGPSG